MAFEDLGGYAKLMAMLQGQGQGQILSMIPNQSMSQTSFPGQEVPPPAAIQNMSPESLMGAPAMQQSPLTPMPGAPVPAGAPAPEPTQPGIWDKISGLFSSSAQAGDKPADNSKWIIPAMAMMHFGAALQAPPEQRGAIMAQLPGNITSLMQQRELAKYRDATLAAKGVGKTTNLSTDQLLADAIKRGDQGAVDKITAAIQAKKPDAAEKAPPNMNDVELFRQDPAAYALYMETKKQAAPKEPRIGLTTGSDGNPVYAEITPGMAGPKAPQFFDPAMVDREADKYNQTGEAPGGFGMAELKKAVMTRAAEKAAEQGMTPNDQIQNHATYGATKSALGQLVKNQTMINAFTDNFDRNVGVTRELAKKVDRTGVPMFNAWVNAGRRSVTGNPDLAALDVSLKEALNEFTRITTTANAGNTQMAEQEINKIEKLLSSAQTPEQLESVLNIMEVGTKNRANSLANAVDIKSQQLRDLALPGGSRRRGNAAGNAGGQGPAATQQVGPGVQGGGGKQLMLPKNGQMVPVDQATYDAYQKKWGR